MECPVGFDGWWRLFQGWLVRRPHHFEWKKYGHSTNSNMKKHIECLKMGFPRLKQQATHKKLLEKASESSVVIRSTVNIINFSEVWGPLCPSWWIRNTMWLCLLMPPYSWPFSGIFGQQVILEWIEHGKIKQIYLVGGLEHFLFSHSVGNNNPNWLSYFSEGLKPPTSY